MPVRTLALALGGCLLLGGSAHAAYRVWVHERSELEYRSPPRTLEELASAAGSTRVSARLAEVELQAGEHALFEVCAADPLDPERFLSAFELAVFRLPAMELMLRVPLDAAHLEAVRRNAHGACLPLGSGVIEHDGRYSVDAVWPEQPPAPELRGVALEVRVLGLRALSLGDRAGVLALGAGTFLLLLGLLAPARAAPQDDAHEAAAMAADAAPEQRPSQTSPAKRVLLGAAALALLVLATRVPSAGAALTFAKGVSLVLLQAGAALLLCRLLAPRAVRAALALGPPPGRLLPWLLAALAVAVLLVMSARLSLRLVPATSEAPIQSFVRWPSGLLCFAALGVLLPLGEELFFRGYLYRVALGFGRTAAFWLTLCAFVALHAEQSWGNWGGLVSIAVSGLALTALRARSESVLIPAVAHVLYNFTLSMASF